MNSHQQYLLSGEQQQQQRYRGKRQKVTELSEEQKKEIETRQTEEALAALFFPNKKSPFTSDL